MALLIRPAAASDDDDAIWAILAPIIAAGETYALPTDMARADALAYWRGGDVFVAQEGGIVGTGTVRANQRGGGAHVANAAFATAAHATGRGVARALCMHALDHARTRGFAAMQFNFVVASNLRAVALWQAMGFAIVGRVPGAFRHPTQGRVDALVMHRPLTPETTMDRATFETELTRDGFEIGEASLGANEHRAEHSHPFEVRALMLGGALTLACEGESRRYGPGDVFTMAPGRAHVELAGPAGASYAVGRKR